MIVIYTILVTDNDELIVSTPMRRIMQKSKLYDYLHFLVPQFYNGFPMKDTTVLMEYTLPLSHSQRSEFLHMSEDLYKDMIEYRLPIDTKLTEEAGDVEIELTFYDVSLDNQQVRKTSKCNITITPISAWSELVPDDALAAIDQRIIQLMAANKQLLDMQISYDEKKADDIALEGNIISLIGKGNKIGTEIDLTNISLPQVNINKDNIDKLLGDGDGSVKKQIADLKLVLEQLIESSDRVITDRVLNNETAIEKLNGTGNGSIKKSIDDAINNFATEISDDGTINTFKELIDYCAANSSDVADMISKITSNTESLKTLVDLIGVIPEGTDVRNVIDYIDFKVDSIDFSVDIKNAKEEAISKSKEYIDEKLNNTKQIIDTLTQNLNEDISENEITLLFREEDYNGN